MEELHKKLIKDLVTEYRNYCNERTTEGLVKLEDLLKEMSVMAACQQYEEMADKMGFLDIVVPKSSIIV